MRKLFIDVPIEKVLEDTKLSIYHSLNQFGSFRKANVESTADNLVSQYKIHPTTIDTDNIKVKPTLGKRVVRDYPGERGRELDTAVIVYTVSYSGAAELFYVQPRQFGQRTIAAEIGKNTITFNVNPDYATLDLPEEKQTFVKQEASRILDFISNNLSQINEECQAFNETLKPMILADIERRKAEEDKLDKLSDNLKP